MTLTLSYYEIYMKDVFFMIQAKAALQFPYGEVSLEEYVDQEEEGELAALKLVVSTQLKD